MSTTRATAEGGFTVLELTVVLGLLAGFLVFLTQLLSTAVDLFDEGEVGQELSDVADAAAAATRSALEDIAPPRRERVAPGPPDARLIVDWVPLGLAPEAPADVQAVRATVRLAEQDEARLLAAALAAEAAGRSREDAAAAARIAERVATAPRSGRGTMLLLPWPADGSGGAWLELRRGLWLPEAEIAVDRRESRELLEIDRLGAALTAEHVERLTEPIAAGLLHFEVALWSQHTRAFDAEGEGGPELAWDSARAGRLADAEEPERRFSLDLAEESLEDATDDVFPRWARVTLVIGLPGREARLAAALPPGATEMRLLSTSVLPDLEETRWLKVGSEWVRHGGASGTTIRGLRRGGRGTRAVAHPAGTPVRAGRTVQLYLELEGGRDAWNG